MLMPAHGFSQQYISYDYDVSGNRVKMSGDILCYYLDECEIRETDRKKIIYLGGDAYTAPMAYVCGKADDDLRLVNICRDYLGSVTHIADLNGALIEEYSYDAWGRMRNPATHKVYPMSTYPKLYLGRGYTGHEHIQPYRLINMNARLYDPEIGRFLSPDPYVQQPDFTQNFNRYSYCVNNPLKYVDKDGKSILLFGGLLLGAYLGGSAVNGNFNPFKWKFNNWRTYAGVFVGGIAGGLGASLGMNIAASATASGMGTIGTGVVSGLVAGAVSGSINGIGMTLVNGGNIFDAYKNGMIGAATGGICGAVAGGISAALGNFTGVQGSSFKNGILEFGHSSLKGFATGLANGAVMATMGYGWDSMWNGAFIGVGISASLASLRILALGTTIIPDKSLYGDIIKEGFVYRRGSVFMNAGEGVTIGKNVSVKYSSDIDFNRSTLQHEMYHTVQIQRMGLLNFYLRTIWEYLRSFFTTGNWKNVYKTKGTLEYEADFCS